MTTYLLEKERRTLAWWPPFVREMFAKIGATLEGKSLDPNVVYDIEAPWPDHRIKIAYISREEFAADEMEEPEGLYLVETFGKRFGGGRWEFRQIELDSLVTEAVRDTPPHSK